MRLGEAGPVGLGKAWRGMARLGEAGVAWRGAAGQGMAGHGEAVVAWKPNNQGRWNDEH